MSSNAAFQAPKKRSADSNASACAVGSRALRQNDLVGDDHRSTAGHRCRGGHAGTRSRRTARADRQCTGWHSRRHDRAGGHATRDDTTLARIAVIARHARPDHVVTAAARSPLARRLLLTAGTRGRSRCRHGSRRHESGRQVPKQLLVLPDLQSDVFLGDRLATGQAGRRQHHHHWQTSRRSTAPRIGTHREHLLPGVSRLGTGRRREVKQNYPMPDARQAKEDALGPRRSLFP